MDAIDVHGAASVVVNSKRTSTSASGEGSARRRSVKLELKLGVVARARSGATLEGDYLPVLALQHGHEVAIEGLAIGRGDFQPERVVASPHDLARDLSRRAGNE